MRVIIFAAIVNVIIFVANLVCMNCISKEVYLNLKRFAKFKCLSNEFERYNIKNSKYWAGISMYVYFAIPAINVVTLFISCFDYDNMVKDIQKTTVNEFMAWVENNK
jgi:hypothetical protein